MTPDRELMAAEAALDRGNPTRALEHINQSRAFDDAATWCLQAEAFLALDRNDDALQSAHRGLQIEPTSTALEILLSRVLSELKRHPEAEAALLRVLNREPENAEALFFYGWLLAHVGDTAGAREIIDQLPGWAKAADPNAMALRAYVAIIDGRKDEAAHYIDLGLQMDPQSSSLHRLAGLKAQLNNRTGTAADHFLTAARADPAQSGDLGRDGMFLNHPLMAANRLIERIGAARLWVGWILFFYIGRQFLPGAVLGAIVLFYIAIAIYSWVAPPLLRRWLQRQGPL